MKSKVTPDVVEPDNLDVFIKYKRNQARQSLLGLKKKAVYYYKNYHSHGKELHKIRPRRLSASDIKEIIKIYENYSSPAMESYRDLLFKEIAMCPYCSISETEQLDHYLPKSLFGEYALFTSNLIPSCANCNSKYKGQRYSKGGARIYFHPYVDEINNYELLVAGVVFSNNAITVRYNIKNSSGCEGDLYRLMKSHFKALNLRERYLKHAMIYLGEMNSFFKGANQNGRGPFQSALDTTYHAAFCEYGHNHWKTALLKNLKNSNDFFNYIRM